MAGDWQESVRIWPSGHSSFLSVQLSSTLGDYGQELSLLPCQSQLLSVVVIFEFVSMGQVRGFFVEVELLCSINTSIWSTPLRWFTCLASQTNTTVLVGSTAEVGLFDIEVPGHDLFQDTHHPDTSTELLYLPKVYLGHSLFYSSNFLGLPFSLFLFQAAPHVIMGSMLSDFKGPPMAAAMCKLSIYNIATDFLWLLLPGGYKNPCVGLKF